MLQQSIGNQAMLRLLAQRATAIRNEPGVHEKENDAARTAAHAAAPLWDFSKIPVFSPDCAERFQNPPPFPAPRLPSPIQAKLKVGPVDDPQPSHQAQGPAAAPPVAAQSTAGQALPETVRERLQPAFDFDFSSVRVHQGADVDRAASARHAAAFTRGHDLFFRSGRFEPETETGHWLIAHELAHVVQQSRGSGSTVRPEAGSGFERHASDAAHLALAGQTVPAAPAGAVPIVQYETEEELRAQLAAVQAQINAERVRIADVEQAAPKSPTWEVGPSGTFERKDWYAIRASETKAYYDLLERRDTFQLRLNFPDHQFLEQVSINRVVTRNGQVFNIPERIADWALIKDDEVILGDKKTAGAIQSGIKGGVPRNRPVTPADLQGSFRTTKGRFTRSGNEQSRTKFGDQVMKERYAIMRATALGGDIIVSGKAADGSTVERKVPPSGLRVSRLNTYGQLPDKLVDEPAGGTPPPRSTPGGRSPGGGGTPGPDEPAPGAPTPTRQGGTGTTAAGHQDEPAAAPPPARTTTAAPSTTLGHADEPAHTPAPPPAKAATPAGSTTPPSEEANVGAPPGTFGGPITGGQVIAAGADVASVVLVPVLNHYIEESYAGIRAQATREYISDAIVAAYTDMQRQISRRSLDIVDAQRRGKTARVYVVVKVGFVDNTESDPSTGTTGTTVSNVPCTSHVMDIQVLLEGERPKPYDESTWLIGDFGRALFSYRSRYYYISLPLGGTDMKLRHQIETAHKVDAAIGRRGSFEELIVQSRLGGQDPAQLREYAEYKAQYAQPSRGGTPIGRDDSVDYWRRMRALIDGPLEDVVKEARLKSVPLDVLKQRVGPESDIGKLIDAPLADKELVARQEHQWTLGGTDAEIARQRAIVEPLRTELRQKQQILNSLYQMDARIAEERAGGEPPHPPWARINRLKQDLADLTERLLVEDKLLKSLEK
jgi:hypothetical protein